MSNKIEIIQGDITKIELDAIVNAANCPNISRGAYGFPKKEAAIIAVKTVRAFLLNRPEIDRVIFVCFDPENFDFIEAELKK